MNIVARLKSINEITKLSALGVSVIMLDTDQLTTKAILPMDKDEMKKAINNIRSLNLNVYIWMNKMIHEYDLRLINQWFEFLKEIDIDGIVINDYTCYVIAKSYALEHKIIYQPGTMNTNSFDAQYLSNKVKGMTLSKEITLKEIKSIIQQDLNIEFSIVGHGFIDMFYSKRKLISLYLDHKSIDQYQVINNHHLTIEEKTREGIHYPILEDEIGTHIFRDKKLQSFKEINAIKNEITDLFIERLFMDDQEYYEAIEAYHNDDLVNDFLEKYGESYHHGFYYQTTQKIKGDHHES